jgi:hypothetical protein
MVVLISGRVAPVKNRKPRQRMAREDEGGEDIIEGATKERHVQWRTVLFEFRESAFPFLIVCY